MGHHLFHLVYSPVDLPVPLQPAVGFLSRPVFLKMKKPCRVLHVARLFCCWSRLYFGSSGFLNTSFTDNSNSGKTGVAEQIISPLQTVT